ncbi:Uncharacterised protein [Mycobacterium tuberculosis]|uniref:Uncharacterized protein n=1 Tax=Mycobacterium tuberculosis TaxID=1773 RepID=A0A916L8D4_MYCTX|nr:Uncharacterised protein [Mycobacterium tuberculosis]
MTASVSAVDLVAQHRCLHRLAAVVVEAALRDVLAEAQPENAAAEA